MSGDFDDLPDTHLEDEDYEAFVQREFDGDGRLRGALPVTLILLVLIALVLGIAFVTLGG